MASFSLAVYGAPYSSQSSYSALRFCQSAVAQGHTIYRVFFYHDAIHAASNLSAPPQDEFDINRAWRKLSDDHNIDLVVCIAAALKRGLLDANEAKRYQKSAANLNQGFTISGLGQMLDAAVSSDRFITFAG